MLLGRNPDPIHDARRATESVHRQNSLDRHDQKSRRVLLRQHTDTEHRREEDQEEQLNKDPEHVYHLILVRLVLLFLRFFLFLLVPVPGWDEEAAASLLLSLLSQIASRSCRMALRRFFW